MSILIFATFLCQVYYPPSHHLHRACARYEPLTSGDRLTATKNSSDRPIIFQSGSYKNN
ncbi:hypothetical protein OGM63_11570 [Plectonema radiosum NIES-515]|uniref:Uncharacterized protein n=1 Tax=Plectonema radiosum NIES-515 TaxID=2986073 RepID=A0ABT3AYE3_9CYAN|nr:hypothetical protein [Plectonema radiosum]MCV3214141.1 hypothetical protein [Plectonema radiosum NIES-515]